MVVRNFHTPDHSAWRVWAVRPAGILTERRRAPDRRAQPVELAIDPPVIERRRGGPDRRRARVAERARGAHVLPQEWQEGWLVFESDRAAPLGAPADVRRLAPIPPDWESCPEPALASYLARAHATERATRSA